MNKAILTGRTTKDIEVRYTTGQTRTAVARFTLAVDRIKDDDPDFISCVAFGKNAENMEKYVHNGNKVGIIGHIQTGSYEKDGRRIYTTDVIVEQVEFLSSKRASEPQERADDDIDSVLTDLRDDDVPF